MPAPNPMNDFKLTITQESVTISHPSRKTESIRWDEIYEIRMINTNAGPAEPDIWLALIGKQNGCVIPHGIDGYDDVYHIVSKFPDFDFENVIKSVTSTKNEQFQLWTRKE
ncbi:hypothetical protein IT413_04540 [Candidatus Peregrinibacteria bacterium]|nr:hypothetical protein [Candidatus Peregrinibacteria bacterium]